MKTITLYFCWTVFIIALCIAASVMLTGCAAMLPGIFQTADDWVTDTAISVEVDKAAMQKETDVKITVDIMNKDKK